MNKLKNFRCDDETFNLFDKIKPMYDSNDGVAFKKILLEIEKYKNGAFVEKQIYDSLLEKCDNLERELKALYIKLGELQGELNIYKQQALPKKSFWKRLFGG